MTAVRPQLDGPTVDAALRHCRDVTRARARNFYYGLKLAPEPARSALFAIYAWMRTADDLVDEALGHDEARGERMNALLPRLAEFRSQTDAALAGHVKDDDPLWVGLAFAADRYQLPAHCFHAMLDGQVQDLRQPCFKSFADVHEYCYRVASTVGLLCIEVWGYDDPSARELAVQRGIAFQLTNIIRDVKQDHAAGRMYLPEEDFARHGLTPDALLAWSNPSACAAFMVEQLERARSYYVRSEPLDSMITPSCRPTLWAMTTIYRGLLDLMRAEPSAIVGPRRIRLSAARKALIAIRAKWMARGSASTPVPALASRNGSV